MRTPFHAGLLEQLLQLGLELEALQEFRGQQRIAVLVGLNQRRILSRRLAFLGLVGAEQAALQPIHVGMPKSVGKEPPQHERANPNRDGDDHEHSVQTSTTSSNRSVRSRTPAASNFS